MHKQKVTVERTRSSCCTRSSISIQHSRRICQRKMMLVAEVEASVTAWIQRTRRVLKLLLTSLRHSNKAFLYRSQRDSWSLEETTATSTHILSWWFWSMIWQTLESSWDYLLHGIIWSLKGLKKEWSRLKTSLSTCITNTCFSRRATQILASCISEAREVYVLTES